MKINFFLVLVAGFLIGCSSTNKVVEPTVQSEALEALISERALKIECEWAYPLPTSSITAAANYGLLPQGSNVSGINLIGNTNYIKIKGDKISMNLPYYGEQQMHGRIDRKQTGLVFDGVPERFEIIKNEKSQQHTIKFAVQNGTEVYNVVVTLFPNWGSSVNINTSHRTSIRYKGYATELEKNDAVVSN